MFTSLFSIDSTDYAPPAALRFRSRYLARASLTSASVFLLAFESTFTGGGVSTAMAPAAFVGLSTSVTSDGIGGIAGVSAAPAR